MSSSSFRTVSVRSGHSYAYALAGVPGSLLGDLEGSLRWGGFSGVGADCQSKLRGGQVARNLWGVSIFFKGVKFSNRPVG